MLIHFEGQAIEVSPGETVLQCIERHGGTLPAFCRRGVCRTCLVKARRGSVPPAAQKGLKEALRLQGLFLACQCQPNEEIELERHGSSALFDSAIERVERLSERVLRVYLSAPDGFVYEAGQFIQLERPGDGVSRAYSIASLPGAALELHVALLPGGSMSQWLVGAMGQPVRLRGSFGECHYLAGEPDRPLCLAGTGTGLAPLLGILRAALAAGHRGPIRLYHGSLERSGLYLWDDLMALERSAPNLRVTGSVLEGAAVEAGSAPSIRVEPLDAAIARDGAPHPEERVFLCGHADLVRAMQKKFYLSGVPLARIHADAFVAPGTP
jgi:CDP-4-dehydro-6-deoxyglucose reductase, E3